MLRRELQMLLLVAVQRAGSVSLVGNGARLARTASGGCRVRSLASCAVTAGAAPALPVRAPPKFVAFPFGYHEEIELTIDDLTNMGDGVGRVQLSAAAPPSPSSAGPPSASDGAIPSSEAAGSPTADPAPSGAAAAPSRWVVMVPFALPGERVRARVFRNHASHSSADLVAVLSPSPFRQPAVCPLFGTCGGCQYQHLSYGAQLAMKRTQVEELLVRVGNLSQACGGEARLRSLVLPPVGLGDRQYGYRTKLTPHYNVPPPGAPLLIGFIRNGVRSQMVDVEACPIASEPINRALPGVRAAAAARVSAEVKAYDTGGGKRPKGATLLLRHALAADGSPTVTSDHHDLVSEIVALPGSAAVKAAVDAAGGARGWEQQGDAAAGTTGRAGEGAQAEEAGGDAAAAAEAVAVAENTVDGKPPLRLTFKAGDFFQNNPFVVPLMVQHVLDEATGPGLTHLIDAYCGSGLFALSAQHAERFSHAVGVETSESSVAQATLNAKANNISTAQFIAGDASAIFAGLPSGFDGAHTAVILDPPRKGCDASFLRQLLTFAPSRIVYVSCGPDTQARDLRALTAAGYELTRVVPFDLFPQTRHIESVATLRWPSAREVPRPIIPADLAALFEGGEGAAGRKPKGGGRYTRRKRR